MDLSVCEALSGITMVRDMAGGRRDRLPCHSRRIRSPCCRGAKITACFEHVRYRNALAPMLRWVGLSNGGIPCWPLWCKLLPSRSQTQSAQRTTPER
jgi:hypothetical protein